MSAAHEGVGVFLGELGRIVRAIDRCVVVDLGCGRGFYGMVIRQNFGNVKLIGVDIWPPYLEEARGRYDELVRADIRDYVKQMGFVDVALMMDVIEHFEKEEGLRLLGELRRRAGHIFVSTPLFPYPQGPLEGNPYEEHKSYWSREEMESLGFRTIYTGNVVGIYVWP